MILGAQAVDCIYRLRDRLIRIAVRLLRYWAYHDRGRRLRRPVTAPAGNFAELEI